MLTILSQSTSDTNRDRGYKSLRERFATWQAVRTAPRREVEDAIRPAGLWKQKARVLQETLEAIYEDRGELDLAHLHRLTDHEVIEYLTRLRGVGVKTAACVLCFSMGRDYMPVDTHVHRVARRLGLIPARTTAEQAHGLLNRDGSVPSELRFSFHILLIRHGRAVCRANRPACVECVLADLCPKVGL
jgi:endonuclease-3